MGIFKWNCRCLICRERGKNLEYVRQLGLYGEAGWWYAYHQKCLDLACESPEDHSHRQVDAALEIINHIAWWKRNDESLMERFDQKCYEIKNKCY